jgi:hypothetical protein
MMFTPRHLDREPAIMFDRRITLPPNLTCSAAIGHIPSYNHQIQGLYHSALYYTGGPLSSSAR